MVGQICPIRAPFLDSALDCTKLELGGKRLNVEALRYLGALGRRDKAAEECSANDSGRSIQQACPREFGNPRGLSSLPFQRRPIRGFPLDRIAATENFPSLNKTC